MKYLIPAIVAIWLVGSWEFMLMVGAVHDAWWKLVPTISYEHAVQISFVLIPFLLVAGFIRAILEK